LSYVSVAWAKNFLSPSLGTGVINFLLPSNQCYRIAMSRARMALVSCVIDACGSVLVVVEYAADRLPPTAWCQVWDISTVVFKDWPNRKVHSLYPPKTGSS